MFTEAAVVYAEGARIGIVTCKLCGAAILVDDRDGFNAIKLHKEWHQKIDSMEKYINDISNK